MLMTTETVPAKPAHLLDDKQYFILNNLALVVLPAVGTLYFALAQIWGLPAGKEVLGSIVAFDTFLGVLVKVGEGSYDSSGAKYDGAINVTDTDAKTSYSLELNTDPADLKNKDEVTFKINPPPIPAGPTLMLTAPPAPPAPPATPPSQ